MANSSQILDKIKRSLDQLGVSASRTSTSVVAGGLTISYVEATIQSPMGGINDASSPFLGIGIANPGKLKIKGAAGENTIAAIVDSSDNVKVVSVCTRMANDVIIEAGDTATELSRVPGHPDLLNMGQ